MSIKNPKFEIFKSENDGKFYWRLYARNGNIILRSAHGYKSKQSCQKSIGYVIDQGATVENYEIETANIAGTGFYFYLVGKTGKIIAMSGNGKLYNSCNWQIASLGVNKGILACCKAIEAAKNKEY